MEIGTLRLREKVYTLAGRGPQPRGEHVSRVFYRALGLPAPETVAPEGIEPQPAEAEVLANGGVIELAGDLELVEGLVQEAIVVLGLLEDALQREVAAGPALAHPPYRAAGALSQVIHNLKARNLKSGL